MKYEIVGDEVHREGTKIATIVDGKPTMEDGQEKYLFQVNKLLKDVLPEQVPTWKLQAKVAFPDAPFENPKLGDKDPSFVRWLHKNHPEDFKHRFAGRKTIIDADKPKGRLPTEIAIEAQKNGFLDAHKRKGYAPEKYGYEGKFEAEYKTGYINGGGRV